MTTGTTRSTSCHGVTMTHSLSQEIVPDNSIACLTFGTRDNRYLRTFTLADFGVAGDFEVSTRTWTGSAPPRSISSRRS